jgi:hypothetical protein
MLELLDQLKKLPKEVLMLIIFDLMKDEVITYHEVTEAHIKYLKMLHDGATDDYYRLQNLCANLWIDYKKNLPKNIKAIMQLLKDEGRMNIRQERIDNY